MVCLCGVFIIFFIYFGTWMLSNGITMSNSRLQIGRILTIDLIGQKMCENQCLTYPNCKAINFNKRHLSCELLTHSGQEAPEQLHFEENTVHIYNITKSQVHVIIRFISTILVICRKEKRLYIFLLFFWKIFIYDKMHHCVALNLTATHLRISLCKNGSGKNLFTMKNNHAFVFLIFFPFF